MRGKREGAVLIVVVIIFMFISIVSSAIISMVVGNYKSRVVESKRVENLYASDSGLDVTYNVIRKSFDAATKYGYYKMQDLKSGETSLNSPNASAYTGLEDDISDLKTKIYNLQHENDNKKDEDKRKQSDIDKDIAKKKVLIQEDVEVQDILLNEEFKRAFKNFIAKTENIGEKEYVPDTLLMDSIEGHKYVSSINNEDLTDVAKSEKTINFAMDKENMMEPKLMVDNIDLRNASENTTSGISTSAGHKNDVSFTVCGSQFYDISVISDFYSEKNVNGAQYDSKTNEIPPNERKLQAKYKMSVPNYKDIYFQNSSGDLHDYLALKDRALTIGGNMSVDNSDNLNVNGNIFVQGVDPTTEKDGQPPTINVDNRTYEKYHGGIKISNSGQVNFSKDVVTRNTFNAQDNVNATIGWNLYGRNVYIGNLEPGDQGIARNSILKVNNQETDESKGQIVLDNDLTLKANNGSKIDMVSFYGINDKNINYSNGNISINNDMEQKVKNSSSIIVNASDNSTSINISKAAYIMGTAHIDTKENNDINDGYQTGESGAAKGNYIAYSIPLNDAEKFEYYNPLQLLDNSNVYDKAEHFAEYWNGKNPATGGINWPVDSSGHIDLNNIHSIGAVVYQENDEQPKVFVPEYSQTLEEKDGDIYKKRVEFASKVYEFGQAATIDDYYNSRETNFSLLMNLNKIPLEYSLKDQMNKGEYGIFNEDKNKEIKITTTDDDKDSIISDDDSNTIEIKIGRKNDDTHKINAVIATDGKVSVESNDDHIVINGSIIASGDLNIKGSNITLNYDSDAINRIQAQNIDTFKAVFGENIIADGTSIDSNTQNSVNNQASSDSNEEGAASNYDLNNFLENKLWKIIK
ncbi:hypothetical protein [uncultured Clostridium sp.]|uniref:hypothetical protein n=1 Tax=uncultured Clostridium sp. TaxID=59620 RepID=UPI0028E38844|nr:hypothetical protein [uncultured Clostridium sp.]